MLVEKQAETDVDVAPAAPSADDDKAWAKENLRWSDGKPICDLANVLRILGGHEDFVGRFIFNETLNKVLDKGTLMLEWRVSAYCADIQERFIPGIAENTVNSALIIVANRTGTRK